MSNDPQNQVFASHHDCLRLKNCQSFVSSNQKLFGRDDIVTVAELFNWVTGLDYGYPDREDPFVKRLRRQKEGEWLTKEEVSQIIAGLKASIKTQIPITADNPSELLTQLENYKKEYSKPSARPKTLENDKTALAKAVVEHCRAKEIDIERLPPGNAKNWIMRTNRVADQTALHSTLVAKKTVIAEVLKILGISSFEEIDPAKEKMQR